MDLCAVISRESDFTFLYVLSLHNTFKVSGKSLPAICICNKTAKEPINQHLPL